MQKCLNLGSVLRKLTQLTRITEEGGLAAEAMEPGSKASSF